MTPAYDVVVVAYNDVDTIGALVRRLVADPSTATVVVVDHGTDGSGDVAEQAGAVVVRNPANPGFGSGHNAGLAKGSSPFVLLLNPDAEPALAAIAEGVAFLAANPTVGIAQGVVMNVATGVPERSQGVELGPVHLWGRALGLGRFLGTAIGRRVAEALPLTADHAVRVPDEPTDVETLAATVLLCRRAALEQVGGFDERFFLYGEDLDLCRRLRAAGFRVVALPSTFATHVSGGASASWWAREVEWWRGTMQFAARWWTPAAWAVAVGAAVARAALLVVLRPADAGLVVRRVLAEPFAHRRARTSSRSSSFWV